MPGMGQIFPYVLPDAGSNRRWCLRGIQITLLVRLAARMSSRSLTSLRPAVILPFFMRGGAPLAHGPLLANCHQLGGSRRFRRGNQPGEARGGRRGMDALFHPLTSAKDVHGRCGEKCLKPELCASDIACAAHFTGSHGLRNGPFHPGSFGIHRSKLRGQLTGAGLMKNSIGLLIGLKDQHACGTVCTLSMERTRLTASLREAHPNDGFAMPIAN